MLNKFRICFATRPACRLSRRLPAVLALLLLLTAPAAARQGGIVLWGDFQVDEGKAAAGKTPETFYVVLYYTDGRVVARQPVSNHGRYRFNNVPRAEYDLVVEMENQEVARMRVDVGGRSDQRQDLFLEWREGRPGASKGARATTVSAADAYERTSENRKLFERAQQATDKKKYDEAADLLKQLVAADAKDFQAWTELGTVHLLRGDQGEAEKAYRRAAEERPTFALAQLNLGRILLAQKKYEAAVEPLTKAVESQPTSAEANHLLGESYLQLKKGSKAVTYLNEALRLDPQGKADLHLRLATLYNAAGLKDRAASEYEQFLAKRPDHPERKKLEKYVSENKKQ